MPFAFVSHCIISDQTKKRDKKEKDQKIVTTSRSFDLRVYKKKFIPNFSPMRQQMRQRIKEREIDKRNHGFE